jgi:hypothetical protein
MAGFEEHRDEEAVCDEAGYIAVHDDGKLAKGAYEALRPLEGLVAREGAARDFDGLA